MVNEIHAKYETLTMSIVIYILYIVYSSQLANSLSLENIGLLVFYFHFCK